MKLFKVSKVQNRSTVITNSVYRATSYNSIDKTISLRLGGIDTYSLKLVMTEAEALDLVQMLIVAANRLSEVKK